MSISLKAMSAASFGDWKPLVLEVGEKFRVEIELLDAQLAREKAKIEKLKNGLENILRIHFKNISDDYLEIKAARQILREIE